MVNRNSNPHRDEAHQQRVLDEKIEEIHRQIKVLEKLRSEVQALQHSGNREQAFFAGRRSMAYELRQSGGLASGRLGLEILYLLPDDFVQFYGSIFHRAFNVGDSSVMHGRSGGVERASGNTGTVLGSENRLQAQGSGKKWKNTPMTIGSEKVMKLKQRMDKELERITHDAKTELQAMGEGGQGLERSGTSMSERETHRQCTNGVCRSFLKAGWKFCPRCGTGTDAGV